MSHGLNASEKGNYNNLTTISNTQLKLKELGVGRGDVQ
jgi:hypothetical protein